MTNKLFVSALTPADGQDAAQLAAGIMSRLARHYPGCPVTGSLSREDGVLSAPASVGHRRLLLIEIANADRSFEDPTIECWGSGCERMVSGLVERFETPAKQLSVEPQSLSPVRLILVLRKLADITRAQFIDYYENHHAPLALRILPRYAAYARNYLYPPAIGEATPMCADVVSEVGFRDQAHFDAFKAVLADRSIRDQIRKDEQHLFDPAFKWVSVVEEVHDRALHDVGLSQKKD